MMSHNRKTYLKIWRLLSLVLLPAACAAPAGFSDAAGGQTSVSTATRASDRGNENDLLRSQVDRLQQQMSEMETRLQQLEGRQEALGQLLDYSAAGRTTGAGARKPTPVAADSEGRRYYRAGLYVQAVQALKGAETGGNGSAASQDDMYLLMQSHRHLRNCESVINIGSRFVANFPANRNAPEALYQIGECRWTMQQQDVARSTWRKLLTVYPDSAAARRAAVRLKK